jgi:hypothetical protein
MKDRHPVWPQGGIFRMAWNAAAYEILGIDV